MESGEVKKYYRWLSGFRSGIVECYLCETEEDIFFESGNSVPKGRFDLDLRQISEEEYTNNSSAAKSAEEQFKAYEALLGNTSVVPDIQYNPAPQPVQTIETKEKSPIQIILEKQKKKTSKVINLDVEVSLPTDKVIGLISVMFDEDEVIDELVEYALKEIDTNFVRSLIEKKIREIIQESAQENE
jgi:hypothetical protein